MLLDSATLLSEDPALHHMAGRGGCVPMWIVPLLATATEGGSGAGAAAISSVTIAPTNARVRSRRLRLRLRLTTMSGGRTSRVANLHACMITP